MRIVCLVVLAVACALIAPATGLSAGSVPDPCTIVPGPQLAASVGLQGVSLKGAVSTRPDAGVKQTLCTFRHGDAELQIAISPHQPSGGSGGPPGMVLTKPSGLGSGATFAYDLNPKFAFANAFFTKGALDAEVWDNGKLPHGDILGLARIVYKALP